MKKWRVGVAGVSRGRSLTRVFGAHSRVEVTALCDIDTAKLADIGKAFNLSDHQLYTDYDAFLAAPMDIVVIATPIALHAEHTIKALQSGRHVLCEQTAAYTVEDCGRIVDAVRRTGLKYMMAENYCYFHYVREWQKIVDAGKIGNIYYAEGEYIHEIINLLVDAKTGNYYWRHSRPPVWYCAHTLGPILMLMKDRVVRGCGLTSGFTRKPEFKDHIGFLDIEVGLFQTAKGALVKILRSQVAARPHMVWYSLYGTKGHLEGQRDRGEGLYYNEEMGRYHNAVAMPCSLVDPDAPAEAKGGGHGTSEYFMIRDFLDAIEQNTQPPIDVARAMDFTVPGLVAHESAMKGGQWMDIPQFSL
jgi:predicted dehydrogenase